MVKRLSRSLIPSSYMTDSSQVPVIRVPGKPATPSGLSSTAGTWGTHIQAIIYTKNKVSSRAVWHTPLTPALERQRQADLCEFEGSLVYRVSSRTVRASQRNPVLRKPTNKQKHLKNT